MTTAGLCRLTPIHSSPAATSLSQPDPEQSRTRTAWMDETQFADEIAEISAEIELLEHGALATLWENGSGSADTVPELINGESRLPSHGLSGQIGVPG